MNSGRPGDNLELGVWNLDFGVWSFGNLGPMFPQRQKQHGRHHGLPKAQTLLKVPTATKTTRSPPRPANPNVGSNIPMASNLRNANNASRRPHRCIQPSTILPTLNDPPHATNRNTNCLAISVKHSERITAAATVGPRGAGNAYIDRSVRSGKRSRYSNSDVDVDSNISCASSEESVAIAAADAFVALGFPLLVAGGDGPPSPPDAAPFRFVPAIALRYELCCSL